MPSRSWYDPVLDATFATGAEAVRAAAALVSGTEAGSTLVAADIETPGLERAFTINCVTFAWTRPDGGVQTVLLDPGRDTEHHRLAAEVFGHARHLVFHNAAFDIPPLHHAQLMTRGDVNRVIDTLLLARLAIPDVMVPKKLEALAGRYMELFNDKGGMERAFKAAGYKTNQAGFEGMDITSPVYRYGAMADTVATLALEPLLRGAAVQWLTDHPFTVYGATTPAEAVARITIQETVHRVMLRRSATGLAVDRDYLDRYAEQVDIERNLAIAELAVHGLEGGTGKAAGLIKYLAERGELPQPWPRTPGGALRATKADLEVLAEVNPLAAAQRKLAVIEKVEGYLRKVDTQASVTGRCHPQVGVLGASATGRMCIPTSHHIVTRRGTLSVDDVRVGDETIDQHGHWTPVTGVHRYADQETIVYRSRLTTLEATDEHRWVSRSESGGGWRVGALDLSQRRSILLAPEGDFDIRSQELDVQTPGELLAAVIGMLVTDGRCVVKSHPSGATAGDMRAHIYQSRRKFYDEWRSVLPDEAVMYDRVLHRPGDNENHEIRLRTRWLRPQLRAVGLDGHPHLTDHPNLTRWVAGLTLRECASFLTAAYMGDGIADPVHGQRMIAQRQAARDAIMLAAYRLGVRCTRRSSSPTGWGTEDQQEVCFQSRSHIHTRHLEIGEGRTDVWCVTTGSGTFTAWSDVPYLTGNSYSSPELQQFPAEARAVITDDGQGLTSIDWSQIEPVTMALMARDDEFLAPFEAGADLYEPIMRSCGIDRPTAKVVLLATMYGQGTPKLAITIGHTEESAAQIKRQMFNAMRRCERWMARVQEIAATHGRVVTAAGRILPVDEGGIFKAVNYVVQGSAYDVLAHTIVTMEERGLGDHLQLALHDELVVDTAVAPEVQQIMLTPPPFLVEWAGRTPVLRTDTADMGNSWKKV